MKEYLFHLFFAIWLDFYVPTNEEIICVCEKPNFKLGFICVI